MPSHYRKQLIFEFVSLIEGKGGGQLENDEDVALGPKELHKSCSACSHTVWEDMQVEERSE